MFFCQTTSSGYASKNSQSIIWNKLLLLRSKVKILIQSEARLQIWEMMHSSFEKVDSFIKDQLSRTYCVSACADGASVMMRTITVLWSYEKGKEKYFGNYSLIHREKSDNVRNLIRAEINFKIYFIFCLSYQFRPLRIR